MGQILLAKFPIEYHFITGLSGGGGGGDGLNIMND